MARKLTLKIRDDHKLSGLDWRIEMDMKYTSERHQNCDQNCRK